MNQIALILSNQPTFSNRIHTLWEQCFPSIELRVFSWILKNPHLNTLLESQDSECSIIIIDDFFVKNILSKSGADHLFKAVLKKFPKAYLIYAFDQSWIQFFKQYPSSICISMKCDDPQDLLIVHVSRLLKNSTQKSPKSVSQPKVKTEAHTPKVKTATPAVDTGVIVRDRSPIDIKKLVKSNLYSLLNQIEDKNVQLKISLPEYPIVIIENRDSLTSFINEHILFLLSHIGGKGYSFIQVNVASAYRQCIVKILHSKIPNKTIESNHNLNVITNESSTQIVLNTPDNEEPTTNKSIRSSSQPTVLVVEDEVLMLEMITTTLESEGFIVEGFSNSIQAARAINQAKYDIILTDINIPNFSGFQVINTIKESSKNKDTKIVAMTGLQNEYTIQSLQELNLDGFLSKPFSLEKLSDLLKRILHKSNA
ncbi:MAG: response regulator [Candidatus Cloacimonetes bacterium]|nr:response regulator [Candidatus Cloacimonadota bacterium]